jgi:hypothetical protein
MISKVGVPPVFPNASRPITLSRVGEFRRLVDRHRRSMQEASPGNTHQTRYISQMESNFRTVKARIHQKIDLIA